MYKLPKSACKLMFNAKLLKKGSHVYRTLTKPHFTLFYLNVEFYSKFQNV